MTKMKLLKIISELSFAVGSLEGYHQGLVMTGQKLEGMDLLLKTAASIKGNIDSLEEWFVQDFCEEEGASE